MEKESAKHIKRMDEKQKYCIIVAGGSGVRMGGEKPKQFIELNGKPVLMHTVERFHRFDANLKLIIALPADQQEYWRELCKAHGFTISHQVVNGGITRFHSVKNALSAVGYEGIVAVHDGVRPLVSQDTIKRCFDLAEAEGVAVPVVPLTDSIREITGKKDSKMVDRLKLRLVQTPQVFQADILQKAYQVAYHPGFTDDASVVERKGIPIALTDGNVENIKLTYPSDIIIAAALL